MPAGLIGNVTAAFDLPPISAALLAYDLLHRSRQRDRGSIMTDVAANVAKKTAQMSNASNQSDEVTALDRRYGQIGISAVAAAVRYQGGSKNPAYAPVTIK
jgi:hypothetical protein